ncbi:SprT family zinc-dependent metalloprotease [Kitasatospora aureofaciens]|uniref:M48 family metallopeptidase n=1 Tax=Kitasatospora aureofaciens TaxID=1894 RepID=UPI0033BF723A
MSTASASLTIRGIDIDVVYKNIKNLHIGVYPPSGRVRVAAPHQLDDEQVRLAVIQRLPWIREKREQLRSAVRQSVREMATGESHYVWGARRRMKVVERPGRAHFELDGERLLLYVQAGTTAERRRELLDRWCREQLRHVIPDLIAKWEPILEVSVPRWNIKRMKTKWGSCNRETGQIWFNVELSKKHPSCLEYVIVHEMVHYLECNHGERFVELMDRFMPNWRIFRDRLDEAPLAEEEWA